MDAFAPLVTPIGPSTQGTSNASADTTSHLPVTVLDSLFPGYSLIQRFVLLKFSIDIGILVTIAAITLGTIKFGSIAYNWFNDNILKYFTTSVIINDSDELYYAFGNWAALSGLSRRARETQAVTPWRDLLEEFSKEEKLQRSKDGSTLFNFGQAMAEVKLKSELHLGYHLYFYKRTPMLIYKYYRSQSQTLTLNYAEEKQAWHLTCLGRSRAPIMALLEHVRKVDAATNEGFTHVCRPEGDYGWIRATTRAVRPMQSVIMEQEQKETIVKDMNDFVWPASARWYASRGIPHRRGYLLSGPPGTGKTSLSFALAGIFGLHLFVLSLTDKSLSDSGLLDLFCQLPDRCIVLLEDVDTAGLKRKGMDKKDGKDKKKAIEDAVAKKDGKSDDDNDDDKKEEKSKITLSGLLNAIDGVATHEGRVIIMTSNCPDELDPALIRPGRIDKHIRFGLASRRQTAELFLSMYTSDSSLSAVDCSEKFDEEQKIKDVTLWDACREIKNSSTRHSDINGLDIKDLRGMSEEFSRKVPEDKFSPAEVQGYLLVQERREDPRRAVYEVEKWVVETLKEKQDQKEKEDKDAKEKEKEDDKRGGVASLTGIWSIMG